MKIPPLTPLSLSLLLPFLLCSSTTSQADQQVKKQQVSEVECSENGECYPPTYDYLIVGAGGGGIQTALFLEQYGHTYAILEKADTVAPFWTRFPVFQELISVNKRVQNVTQRYRYDWHSFLETPVHMWNVSTDYFPTGQEWHQYMERVVKEGNLNIELGVEVQQLAKDGTPCVTLMDHTVRCAKYRVFVGTGLQEKEEPYLRAMGGIPYSQMTRAKADGKRVCIAGNGNAGFETAANIFGVADRVIVYGKRPARLSSVTKYTGDVRVKFLTPLENFHGKLLDTVLNLAIPFQFQGIDDILNRTQKDTLSGLMNSAMYVLIHKCEVLVIATGFRSVVPGVQLKRRFPLTDDWYAARDNPTIHYVGWLMHQRDFRKGAGGFLSGYRYLIRNLLHHVQEQDHGVDYPHLTLTGKQVLEHACNRFQIADDLIILQDGVVVRDVILPVPVPEGQRNQYHYYEGVTYQFMKELLDQRDDAIYLYFAWGDGRSAATVFDNVYLFNDTMTLRNIYLHPIVEVNGGLIREAEEDLDMIWNTNEFIAPIKRILRDALRKNYTKFYPRPDFSYQPLQVPQPKEGTPYEKGENEGVVFHEFTQPAIQAIQNDAAMPHLKALRAAAKRTLKSLEFPAKKKQIQDS